MLNQEAIENNIRKKFSEKIIYSFLDIIILGNFQNETFSGYDIIQFIQNKFGSLISPGTAYSTLYAMERRNLVTGTYTDNRKRTYKLTEKGKLTLRVLTSKNEIETFMKTIFPKNSLKT